MEKILITGCAGFIGMHLCKRLLNDGYEILGIDNMNDYYSPRLKEMRLDQLKVFDNFSFIKADISKSEEIKTIFKDFKPERVINLAAQAGVRYSLQNPQSYINSNVVGFMNILEMCKEYRVKGLIYASSSSVYGGNDKIPFSEIDSLNSPISIYAVTKISNELMAKVYSHLYGLKTTGLRFFSVYGPWGRPDMAIYIFVRKILNGETISVYNNGNMKRDFTYIEDIIEGTKSALIKNYDCEVFNLGNSHLEPLMHLIALIEKTLGKKAKVNFEEMQSGDVKVNMANIDYARNKLDYNPKTPLLLGLPKFIDWYNQNKNLL